MKYSIAALASMAIGTMGAAFFKLGTLFWLLALLGMVCLFILLWIFHHSRTGWILMVGLACFSGFYFSLCRDNYLEQLNWNQQFGRQTVTIEGVMVKRTEMTGDGKSRFILKTTDRIRSGPAGRLAIYYRGEIPEIFYGRRLRLTGKFKTIPSESGNFPGYLELQQLTGRMTLNGKPLVLPGWGLPPWYRWAEKFRRRLSGYGELVLSPAEYQLLHGMVYGEELPDATINRRLKQDFRRTGTVHLLTVSGLHVGFVAFGLNMLLAWCRVPKRWRIPPLVLGVWFYMMMAGMETPVFRAGMMLLIYIIAQLLGVKDDALNRLGLAGCFLLLLNPYNLFDAGFQLSFTATLGVVWLYPLLKEFFPIKFKWFSPVWRLFLLSAGAQLMIVPVVIHYFGQISWGSPIVNILLMFPAEFVVMGGLLGETIGIFLPGLGQWVLIAVGWNIRFIQWVVHLFGELAWVGSWSPKWPWPWIIGYYLGLLLLLDWVKPNLLTKQRDLTPGSAVILILVILNSVIWGSLYFKLQNQYLEVVLLDVGEGDAIFIKGPGGTAALVDAGDDGLGRRRVLPFLRQNGILRLDMVFVTHGDRDHMGGMDEVLEEIPVGALYLPKSIDQAKPVQLLLAQLKLAGIPVRMVNNETRFKLDQTVHGEILYISQGVPENDRCLVLRLEYGKNKLLLTGDLGLEGEEIFVQKYPYLLRASGLKVGHHGSNHGSTLLFLTQVQPEYALISVGADNLYGHPGLETLNRLRSLGVKVFRTDRHGPVRLRLYPDKTVVIPTKVDFDDAK